MKLKVPRDTLLQPLQMVIGVVEQKQTLPVLSHVLLKTSENSSKHSIPTLSITGTDLEVELIGTSPLDNDITINQKVTLPGKKLIDICKTFPEDATVELYQEKEQVIVKSGRSRFTLSSLPAEEFPCMDEIKKVANFDIAQNELRALLQRTSFAMAQHDVRYYLNGVLLEIMSDRMRAVATDGHRLAMNTLDVNTNTDHKIRIIVPRKGVLELIRLLDDTEQPISVVVGNNFIRASSPTYTFTSKLVEGRYPEYERVIPKTTDKELTIEKIALKTALQRSAILCNEKFRGVRLELRKDLLRILSNNPEHEAAEEELKIAYTGEDLDIGFNVTYLIENINIIKSKNVILKFSSSSNSMLLEESDPKYEGIFVVMPMRL